MATKIKKLKKDNPKFVQDGFEVATARTKRVYTIDEIDKRIAAIERRKEDEIAMYEKQISNLKDLKDKLNNAK